MHTLTVDEAARRRVCRVCGIPIDHPFPLVLQDEHCWNGTGRGDRVITRGGNEYAHSACLDGEIDRLAMQA